MFFSLDYQIYMFIGLALGGVGMLVQGRLRSKFEQYSKVPISKGWTGKQVAEAMLKYYGIYDVQVLPSDGFLSDHYNPGSKTVNLSSAIYGGSSVMAAAVAAHECGHAVQHAQAYADDSQIDRLIVERTYVVGDERCEVELREIGV